MTTTAPTRDSLKLPESIDLGEFTLLIHGRDERSGEPLAKEIRALIAQEFAKRDLVLSLLYEIEIEEFEVGSGSRKSKNRVRLKRKKGRTLWETIKLTGSAFVVAIGLLSADYSKIPENLEWVCEHVVHVCEERGHQVEIRDKHFYQVDIAQPRDDTFSPGDHGV